jgi:hypothetical protein
MRIKDHYKTLGVSQAASLQDIKKAYRKLAFQYHPDHNPQNAFAEASFKELQEAYSVLSHSNRRRAYDEERWLAGMGTKARHKEAVTPQWILDECRKLNLHLSTVDTYRMSHSSLRDYILLLLSDAHMGVLLHDNDATVNEAIVTELLRATRHLQYEYMAQLAVPLQQLAGSSGHGKALIAEALTRSKRQAGIDRYFSIFVLAAALVLALLMYLYGRKK